MKGVVGKKPKEKVRDEGVKEREEGGKGFGRNKFQREGKKKV